MVDQSKQICIDGITQKCPWSSWLNPLYPNQCTWGNTSYCKTFNQNNQCEECMPEYILGPNNGCGQYLYGRTYAGGTPLRMYDCDASCAVSCIGPGPGGCLTTAVCTLYNRSPSNDFCQYCTWHSSTYYIHSTRTCGDCHPNCSQCYGPSNTQCFSCNSNYEMYDGNSCYARCPDGFYATVNEGNCLSCHSSCGKCRGPSPGDCISCPDGWYFNWSRCLPPCPTGFVRGNGWDCQASNYDLCATYSNGF
jgi:proprotein convertase subtilisin/kexin type 5